MPVVAWRLGSEPVFTYTVLLELGLLCAAALLSLEGRRRGWRPVQVLEVLVWTLVPAVLGGRAFYLLLSERAEDAASPFVARQPWGGGLSLPGAMLAGAAGLAVLAVVRGRAYAPSCRGEASGEECSQDGSARPSPDASPLLAVLAAITPGLALAQALGWLGAAVHGAAAGVSQPPASWWAPQLRDLYGVVVPRFPLQYLAAALSVFTWAILTWGRLREDRERVAAYAVLMGWGLFALSFGLERRLPAVGGLSLDQLAYLGIGVAGMALGLARRRQTRGEAGVQKAAGAARGLKPSG